MTWGRLCIAHIARGLGRPHNCPRKRWARAQRQWLIHLGDLPHMPHKDNPSQVLRIPGWVRAQIVRHQQLFGWAQVDPALGPPYLRITQPSAAEDDLHEAFNAPAKTYGPTAIFSLEACDEAEARDATAKLRRRKAEHQDSSDDIPF